MAETDKEGQLRQFKEWFRVDKDHCRKWHQEAKEDFEFLAGEQWTEQERKILKEQLRPVITFNRTHPIIQSISGQEIANRQEVKYFPREEGDAKANEILTEGSKWFRDQADADDEDSDAFLDALTCGVGVTETTLNFDMDEAGLPDMDAVNPLEVLWDCNARKKNFVDRRRQWRVRRLPASVVLEMFDGVDRADIDASWATMDDKDEPQDREQARFYEGNAGDLNIKDDDLVTLVHLQYKKKVPQFIVATMEGKSPRMDKDKFQAFKERADMMGIPYAVQRVQGEEVRNVFIGGKVLQDTRALSPKCFSFQFVTAYMDRVTGLPYGLMRIMKDPQRWSNKWMSQALHILNVSAKGGLMIEEDATDNIRDLERNWARPDKIAKFLPGAIANGKVKEKPVGQFPSSFFQMMQFAIQSVRDVTGISVELLGMREANQAASLEFQRRQAGMIIIAPLFDNLKRYRREQGRLMLYIIQNYLNDGRLVRIVGDGGAKYVPMAIDASQEYDIIVDEQVNSADQKLVVWQSIMPILPALPPQVQLALVDYAPLPTSVIEKIKEAAKSIGPDPEQQAIAMQTALKQLGKLDAEINETNAGAERDRAEANKTTIEAEIAALTPFEAGSMNLTV